MCTQIMNATTVHVRRPGNPKKWRARVLCEGIICDLALLTVDEPGFWSDDLMSLQFVAVPELQARPFTPTCMTESRRLASLTGSAMLCKYSAVRVICTIVEHVSTLPIHVLL